MGVSMKNNTPLTQIPEQDLSEQPLITHHLNVGYENHSIVKEVNVHLTKGQTLALVGMNGSGKSTFLKTIVGLLAPLGGDIKVFNTWPGRTPKQIGYLSQFHSSGFILPLQVIDIVRMGRYPARGLLGKITSEDNDIVQEALVTMGVSKLANKPLNLLSGGQQQRVFIAQVFAQKADILLLDEPSASLDAAGKELFLQAMQREKERGVAIVSATHDIREAAECDLVMLLAQRVVALDTPSQALTPAALLETFGVAILQKEQCMQLAVVPCEHEHS